jgi:NADPH:quinone reductase-like Zn-dependent oxidoreductase
MRAIVIVPVDRVFPLAEAAAAPERIRGNAHLGKIVLRGAGACS